MTVLTAEFLQDALAVELGRIFADCALLHPNGEREPPAIFKQEVPLPDGADGFDDEPAPYVIVRLLSGGFADWNGGLSVSVALIICAYDGEPERHGIRDVISMITKVFTRFAANPHLGDATCKLPIDWVLQTEVDTYPYYFGACELNFAVAGVSIEDELA